MLNKDKKDKRLLLYTQDDLNFVAIGMLIICAVGMLIAGVIGYLLK